MLQRGHVAAQRCTYGQHSGEGLARSFKVEGYLMDEEACVRLQLMDGMCQVMLKQNDIRIKLNAPKR